MSEWIAGHFWHPSYVLPWGIALAALPVIIHLINRLRYKRVRFAAMDFLLNSERRNRRRVFLEQLLLLLLRVAIVMGVLALLARLVVDPSALWAFRGAKSHHVVLLDDSGSMRDRWGETSAFQEGIAVVRKLVAEGMRRPGTEQITLVLLSQTDRPLFLKRDVNNALAAELDRVLERLACTYRPLDLIAGVEAAGKILRQDAGTARHFHVISDFRASDWQERASGLRAAFLVISKTGASIDLARTVAESHENLAITDLSGDVRAAAAGVPIRLAATVHNFGSKVAENVRLAVTADSNLLPLTVSIDRLEPGQERRRDIDLTFKKPGKHAVEVKLPEDSLPADGKRFAALEVNVANPVLIIDGDPESDDASYVATALAADPSITGFSTRVETPDFLSKEPLEPFRCIYLLNVPQLRPDAIEILAEYVRQGGGVAWFLGSVVNPAFYNEALHNKAQGLFPVPLAKGPKQNSRADESTLASDIKFSNHPVFRIFQGQTNPFIDAVRIHTWIPVADGWKDEPGVQTIAWLGDNPLAFERAYGKGRILAFLTSGGPRWTNWPANPSVVVFHLELAKHIARPDQTREPRIVGEPIDVTINAAEYLETVEITAPDVTGQRVVRVKATRPADAAGASPAGPSKGPVANASATAKTPDAAPRDTGKAPARGESRLKATYADTDQPGMYVVRLFKDQSAAPQERWLAYNVSTSESDLKLATTAEILARLSSDVHVQIHELGTFEWIEGHGSAQEARTLLLVLLGVALVAEQLFAYRLSYHPTTAKGAA